jgi:hypothetical protein
VNGVTQTLLDPRQIVGVRRQRKEGSRSHVVRLHPRWEIEPVHSPHV